MAVRSNIVGIDSPEALEKALRAAYYLADEGLATAAYLGLALGKPLLLEGAPGVGKTEAAKAIAAVLGRRLIRLQCYEGIDASAALYEWNYPRQMLAIRQAGDESIDIYGEAFLIERPMLATLRAPDSTVLLIDEIDRADQEFEAFLLEFLSDFQISIPERGTVRASERPVVVLTSNRTRDLHEALRRRCVYHWIDYPSAEREARIVMMRASSVAEGTARAVVAAVEKLRREPLSKAPGIAEAVDWAEAATLLHKSGARWPDAFRRSIGVALKDEEDLHFISPRLDALLAEAPLHEHRTRTAARCACLHLLRRAVANEQVCRRTGTDDLVPGRDPAARPTQPRRHSAGSPRNTGASAGASCHVRPAFRSALSRKRGNRARRRRGGRRDCSAARGGPWRR
ncbi:MoxR-like ATPase [Bradyrhizobium sp. LM6.10]